MSVSVVVSVCVAAFVSVEVDPQPLEALVPRRCIRCEPIVDLS